MRRRDFLKALCRAGVAAAVSAAMPFPQLAEGDYSEGLNSITAPMLFIDAELLLLLFRESSNAEVKKYIDIGRRQWWEAGGWSSRTLPSGAVRGPK